MSIEEVRNAEVIPLVWEEELDFLIGEVTVFDMTAMLAYHFEDQQLDHALYFFSEVHEELNLYVDDYNRVKENLISELGAIEVEYDQWSQDLYRDQKENWGLAVKKGHLTYTATWEAEKTAVALSLSGEDNEICLTALFRKR